jgi:hypothetical protein
MHGKRLPQGRSHLLVLLGCCLVATATGCASNDGIGRLHPVSGKVTLDGKALTTGAVSFRPDPSRGNTSPHVPTGQIDREGNYRLTTANRAGAPPGWYRVLVIAQDTGSEAGSAKSGTAPRPVSLVPPRYLDPQNTPLQVEVVEKPSASAYDLSLSK